MDCLETAISYAARGKSVIPVSPEAKIPVIPWKEFQARVATEEEIQSWWEKYPDVNVGLVCGYLSNIFVVDCDSPEATKQIQDLLPDSIEVPMQRSPGGGTHFFFQHTAEYRNKAKVSENIDIRTTGGQVLISPSSDQRGQYEWISGDIFEIQPPALPKELHPILQKALIGYRESSPTGGILQPEGFTSGNPAYNNKDLSLYIEGAKTKVQNLDLGSRSDTIFRWLMRDRRKGLTDIQVLENAIIYGRACVPRMDEFEVQLIYRSAMSYDLKDPGAGQVQAGTGGTEGGPGTDEVQDGDTGSTDEVRLGIKSELALWITEIGSCLFTLREAYESSGAVTPSEKSQVRVKLASLCEEGKIKRLVGKSITYRSIKRVGSFTDYKRASAPSRVNLWLPLGIDKKGKIFQANHIVIAGPTGKGKTTFVLNMIQENMRSFSCYYYGSEMTAGEIQEKIRHLNIPLEHWTMWMIAKKDWSYNDIVDHIAYDRNGIHFVDYLSPDDDKFYNIGQKMQECCDQLDKGVIVFSVQQNHPESKYGVGGAFSAHGSVMYIALNYDKVELVKMRFTEEDPNRLCTVKEFTMGSRGIYYDKSDWFNPRDAGKKDPKEFFKGANDD